MAEPHGILDVSCPLEPTHPINRGLVGCWAAVPSSGWRGGVSMRDLVRGWRSSHDGTLTSMAFPPTVTSGWQGPRGRPGGYGAVAFDGTDDYVGVPDADALDITGDLTIACWVNPSTFTGDPEIVNKGTNGYEVEIESTGKVILAKYGVAVMARSTVALVAGAWTHIVCVRGGSANHIYFNAVDVTTNNAAATFAANAIAVTVGANHLRSSNFLNGYLDDIRLYPYALSVNEVRALHDESRRGYPEAWRWLTPPRAFSPQAGGLLLARRRAAC